MLCGLLTLNKKIIRLYEIIMNEEMLLIFTFLEFIFFLNKKRLIDEGDYYQHSWVTF